MKLPNKDIYTEPLINWTLKGKKPI